MASFGEKCGRGDQLNETSVKQLVVEKLPFISTSHRGDQSANCCSCRIEPKKGNLPLFFAIWFDFIGQIQSSFLVLFQSPVIAITCK